MKAFTRISLVLLLTQSLPVSAESARGGVSLLSNHARYACAEGGGGGAVVANRPTRGQWETYTLIDWNGGALQSGDLVSFRSDRGNFVCAESGGGSSLVCNRTSAGPWEKFAIQKVGGSDGAEIRSGDKVALSIFKGPAQNAAIDPNQLVLSAPPVSGQTYYVSDDGQDKPVVVNRTALGPWESWTISW